MKRYIYLLFALSPLYSVTESDKIQMCASELIKDKIIITSLKEMNDAQLQAVQKFLDSGIKSEMQYKDSLFIVTQSGEFPIYEIKNDNSYDVNTKQKFKYGKVYTYKFSGESSPRPYPYISAVFKLGGGVFYDSVQRSAYPDMLLLFELLSFDRLIGVYGFSLNVSVGLRHVGGSLGYQMHNTHFFKNTSLMIGYSHDFTKGFQSPYLGISLNF